MDLLISVDGDVLLQNDGVAGLGSRNSLGKRFIFLIKVVISK